MIELLVVVAIISLLVAILLPSLASARAQAKAVKCSANMANVGKAMAVYLATWNGTYPAAYVYPEAIENYSGQPEPVYDFNDQIGAIKFKGELPYVHWSYFLYSSGKVNDEAFMCPAQTGGGAPRTNPGPDPSDWEPNQVDDAGNGGPRDDSLEDFQAPRMAYTINAAICPRNKFQDGMRDKQAKGRVNRFVQEQEIKQPGTTVLATEFHQDWRRISKKDQNGKALLVKSHRPIHAFWNLDGAFNEHAMLMRAADVYYRYGPSPDTNPPDYGIYREQGVNDTIMQGILDNPNASPLNVVGRHHPGGNEEYGGTSNFLYCDGHVDRKGLIDTVTEQQWGDKFYSLRGFTDVDVRSDTLFQERLK